MDAVVLRQEGVQRLDEERVVLGDGLVLEREPETRELLGDHEREDLHGLLDVHLPKGPDVLDDLGERLRRAVPPRDGEDDDVIAAHRTALRRRVSELIRPFGLDALVLIPSMILLRVTRPDRATSPTTVSGFRMTFDVEAFSS